MGKTTLNAAVPLSDVVSVMIRERVTTPAGFDPIGWRIVQEYLLRTGLSIKDLLGATSPSNGSSKSNTLKKSETLDASDLKDVIVHLVKTKQSARDSYVRGALLGRELISESFPINVTEAFKRELITGLEKLFPEDESMPKSLSPFIKLLIKYGYLEIEQQKAPKGPGGSHDRKKKVICSLGREGIRDIVQNKDGYSRFRGSLRVAFTDRRLQADVSWELIAKYAKAGDIQGIPEGTTIPVLRREFGHSSNPPSSQFVKVTLMSIFNSTAWHILQTQDKGLDEGPQTFLDTLPAVENGLLALNRNRSRKGDEGYYRWMEIMNPRLLNWTHFERNEDTTMALRDIVTGTLKALPYKDGEFETFYRFIEGRLSNGNMKCPTREELRSVGLGEGPS